MPYLLIRTNQKVADAAATALLTRASHQVAELLGKPERYVMVSLEQSCAMLFGGSADPLAYLELKSIGLPGGETGRLSAALCDLVGQELGIPGDRIYIEFSNASGPLWGWNGATF